MNIKHPASWLRWVALAIMAISPELAKNASSKPKAVDALKSAIEKCADPSIRERAQKALAALQ